MLFFPVRNKANLNLERGSVKRESMLSSEEEGIERRHTTLYSHSVKTQISLVSHLSVRLIIY